MADEARNLVILMTRGTDHELSSVGFTIACGSITAGMKVTVFLTSAAVDLVRKGASDMTLVQPLSPLKELILDFMKRGGMIYACTPCAKARAYEEKDLIDGVKISGASVILEQIKNGAGTLSF